MNSPIIELLEEKSVIRGRAELKVVFSSISPEKYYIDFSEKEKESVSRYWIDFNNIHNWYDSKLFKTSGENEHESEGDNVFEAALSIVSRRYLKKLVNEIKFEDTATYNEVNDTFFNVIGAKKKQFLRWFRVKVEEFISNKKEQILNRDSDEDESNHCYFQVCYFSDANFRDILVYEVDEDTI